MLRFLKSKRSKINKELFKVLSGKELLQDDYLKQKIRELKLLTSVTKSGFYNCYLEPIVRFAEYVQQLPDLESHEYNDSGGLLKHALDRAVAALKIRRGYMLPYGADAETCLRDQDKWTYAVFTASLLKDCWQVAGKQLVTIFNIKQQQQDGWLPVMGWPMPNDCDLYYSYKRDPMQSYYCKQDVNLMLIRQILSEDCFLNLCNKEDIFKEWLAYVLGKTGEQSQLYALIETAENKLHDLSIVVGEVNELDYVGSFINWLQLAISQASIVPNQTTSVIHRVKEGVLLVFPDSIEKFQASNLIINNYIKRNQVDDFAQHILSLVSVKRGFIRNHSEANFIHEYSVNAWQDFKIIKGLLISDDLLFSENELPEISKTLLLKPKL